VKSNFHPQRMNASVKDETLEGEKRCRAEIGTIHRRPFIIIILCSFMFGFVFVFAWSCESERSDETTLNPKKIRIRLLTYIIDYIKKKLDMTSASAITRKSESVGHERIVHSISCVSMNELNKREILKSDTLIVTAVRMSAVALPFVRNKVDQRLPAGQGFYHVIINIQREI
jgi:hypothetical protein